MEENYSSLVPCTSLFPSSVRKFFDVLFCWGLGFFLKKDKNISWHSFDFSQAVSYPSSALCNCKKPPDQCGGKTLQEMHKKMGKGAK